MRFFKSRRRFVLAAGLGRTYLIELLRPGRPRPEIKLISTVEGLPDNEITVTRLLSELGTLNGQVAVCLPLTMFEIVSLSLPLIPEETIGRALAYHLAKAIDNPLQDFIYDWQLVGRHKDSIEISAYLLPRKVYALLQKSLDIKKLKVNWLEPNIFAAFGCLDHLGRLNRQTTCLCSMVWGSYSSHAVYENGLLRLVRNISLPQPSDPYRGLDESFDPPTDSPVQEDIPATTPKNVEETPTASSTLALDQDDDSILMDFSLSMAEAPSPTMEPPAEQPPPASPPPAAKPSWSEYINSLGLEIIRTRDYFATIIKGSPIERVYIGGSEDFHEDLNAIVSSALSLEPAELLPEPSTEACPAIIEAITIGAGNR